MPPPYDTTVSQNIKKHLKNRHKITIEKALSKNQIAVNKQFKQLYQQAEANNERNKFNIEILEAYLNTSVIIKILIIFIEFSFDVSEWSRSI